MSARRRSASGSNRRLARCRGDRGRLADFRPAQRMTSRVETLLATASGGFAKRLCGYGLRSCSRLNQSIVFGKWGQSLSVLASNAANPLRKAATVEPYCACQLLSISMTKCG